jgi:hypothetical protein
VFTAAIRVRRVTTTGHLSLLQLVNGYAQSLCLACFTTLGNDQNSAAVGIRQQNFMYATSEWWALQLIGVELVDSHTPRIASSLDPIFVRAIVDQ